MLLKTSEWELAENTVQRNSLFRESALEKTAPPDELDRLMQVVSPKGWLALVALGVLVLAAAVWGLVGSIPLEIGNQRGVLLHAGGRHEVVTPAAGLVTDVTVAEGDSVQDEQTVATVQPVTGGAVAVKSLFAGRVDSLGVQKGMVVSIGQQLAILEDGDKSLQMVALVPIDDGKQIAVGMQVHVSPSTARADDYGFIRGTVASVSEFPITRQGASELFLNDSLVDTLYTKDNQLEIVVDLARDPSTPSGLRWSSSTGPPFAITHGTLCVATFVLGEERPINLVVPSGRTGR